MRSPTFTAGLGLIVIRSDSAFFLPLAKEQTDARRIRRWEDEIAARERMIRAERFEATTGESFPAVKVAFPPPGDEKAAP